MEPTANREPDHRSVFRTSVQVAAVCYRRGPQGIEFLLVRTSSGKWIFPKGRAHSLLSDSEAALREAWEEAGVIGSIDPCCFHTFWYFKGSRATSEEPAVLMKAYLVEVFSQNEPEEDDRMPTWFTAVEARRRLSQDRDLRARSALVSAIDRALERFEGAGVPASSRAPRVRGARVDVVASN